MQGWTVYWKSARYEYDQRPQHRRFLPLLEAGLQPLDILIDQAHRHRMRFVAGLLPELDAIAGLPGESRETLYAWLDNHWEPLDPTLHGETCVALERLIQEASGRPLRSREFLDELL